MGRYKRKSTRHSWSEENMREAIMAVREKKMGWFLASKTFNVPSTTLRRRVNTTEGWKKNYLGGHKVTFNETLENEIVEHLRNLEIRFFGFTTTDVRNLAYQVAEAKKITHRFSHVTKMAGWDWLKGFRDRNPIISLRTPESTSFARASAFNKEQIQKYFSQLSDVLEKHNFEANDIWNVDESGFSTVPSKNTKIFATRGRKQVGILTSAERGQHFTVVCSMNAVGTYIPPAIIFPRKNMKNELMDNAPTAAVGFAQENGWMNAEVFVKWLRHFVKFVKPSPEKPVLLLLDGHSSHKSLEVFTYAKESGIILFCFPPHCTHRVQPLDVSFYGPLTAYYNQELNNWLRNHPGRTVTHFQVAEIFKSAYIKSATVQNAQHGFAKTGICPYNANIFPEHMFAPAEVTNIVQNAENTVHDEAGPSISSTLSSVEIAATSAEQSDAIADPPDGREDTETATDESVNYLNTDNNISVADISPLPVTSATDRKTIRRKGKYGHLNTTPEIQVHNLKVFQ